MGFHTFFGDGTEVSEDDLKHVRDVTWKNMVFARWKEGDIVMIDNFRVSHGRQVCTYILTAASVLAYVHNIFRSCI